MAFTVRNHYVPQWYQRRFLLSKVNGSKLWYLDLKPNPIRGPNGLQIRDRYGKPVFRDALRNLGPVNCFQQEHLYTLYFGNYASDVIEKRFFGDIDNFGGKAVEFFENYGMREGVHDAFRHMLDYLAAQLFRTPKGLKLLQQLTGSRDHQTTLGVMSHLWQLYHTIWSEAVWEVVECKESPTKFIVSDVPVVTYNKRVFPESSEAVRHGGAEFERIGTHVIFPLDLNHCLILTNLQYVRNPNVNGLKVRENPRYFQEGMVDLRKVQRGREIPEEQVLAINHILKSQAHRYIAAPVKEWLYPERYLTQKFWTKLGGQWFLMPDPRKVSFTTGIVVGLQGGGGFSVNEYGHRTVDDQRAQLLRKMEWSTFEATKKAWDARDRREGREPPNLKEYRGFV